MNHLMANKELILEWAKTRPWYRIVVEGLLLLLFVLSSTRLLRH